jgi:hypothetical protein
MRNTCESAARRPLATASTRGNAGQVLKLAVTSRFPRPRTHAACLQHAASRVPYLIGPQVALARSWTRASAARAGPSQPRTR